VIKMAEVKSLEERFDEVYGSPEAYQPAKFEPIEQPQAALVRFVETAKLAKQVIEKAGFEITIQGRRYITAQGWSVLGSMFGLTVRTRSIEHRTTENGKAQVVAYVDVLRHGQVIGGAAGAADYEEASWRRDAGWENRPYSHLVSLAQTRATRKALQLLLSHIVALAGYETEELPEQAEKEAVKESKEALDIETIAEALRKALTEVKR
jgi:hypothetical protein